MSTRHDVLFYVPNAAPALLPGERLPAGGAETQMVAIARELARRGLRVAFVVYGEAPVAPVDGIDVTVQRPPTLAMPVLTTFERSARTMLAVARGNAKVIVQRNASVVTGLVALAARLTRRRFVYSSANVVDFEFGRIEPSRVKLAMYHMGIRMADVVVVQTPEQIRLAGERLRAPSRLIRSVAEPADPRGSAPSAFLWIGRLADYKHPEKFLELAARVPEASFRLVGVASGPDERRLASALRERARSLPNVELLEPRPRTELDALYEDAVAVVNTAEFEGMPNVFLEAWSRGVPALALKHDPDDLLERERLGAFAHGDLNRMAEHARAMWDGRENQHELAARCVEYVRSHHSLEAAATAWADLIRGFDA
jgi:glycosyltransferase involved in cell wall biosynthesis